MLCVPAAIVCLEIVAAVVSDLLSHCRRADVECIMAEAAEGTYVFLATHSTAGTGDIVCFWESVNGFAVHAAVMIAFPYAVFDSLGNGARFSALA